MGTQKTTLEPEEIEILEPFPGSEAESVEGEVEPEVEGSLIGLDPLQRYLTEINRYPLLHPEEEKQLAQDYVETGNPEAAYRLITANLRLVVKIALDFQRYWTKNLLDLIQEGNIGLMQAVKKFDPYRGIKLSYYASFWIKAYILKFIMDNWKLVKIGTTQSQRKLFYNLRKEKEKLEAQGFDPGPKLLAHRLKVKEEEVIEMDERLGGWELSLDAPLKENSEELHKNSLATPEPSAEEHLARQEMKDIFKDKLKQFRSGLKDKEKDILDLRLLAEKPLTLQEIGTRHQISRERVRQIEERLLNKLRQFMQEEIPDFGTYQSLVTDPG
ncbi:MAG: RNA polymerase factor sigma-32 [Deltaproteobacteria bacterium]|nr:RNA polymerase factor sigma-32 [Deltaproteobacteria bacterium]MBW1952699.1 RNA polymerase factor sigma-32 [Deltaproteobacteria bacterium]MBW1986289.1 RNA polymerase factor sigma-32 [Deltaproteobacteria bacterium]MBW2134330.1 RNA polymerase factor sigma-32 [Deltaproteobacteria bacterium]